MAKAKTSNRQLDKVIAASTNAETSFASLRTEVNRLKTQMLADAAANQRMMDDLVEERNLAEAKWDQANQALVAERTAKKSAENQRRAAETKLAEATTEFERKRRESMSSQNKWKRIAWDRKKELAAVAAERDKLKAGKERFRRRRTALVAELQRGMNAIQETDVEHTGTQAGHESESETDSSPSELGKPRPTMRKPRWY
ncbi:hypothetical protein C8F01DRAFT_447035 [Mycena amicta]|nr:hypothetical protein C8F01DRAFT_447035 [Mycena amicta]